MTVLPSLDAESLLAGWIDLASTTGQEHAFVDELARFFTARGWFVARQPVVAGRDNLLVTAAEGVAPRVLFSTHVDTVPPHLPFVRDGEKLRGRGACDTKGGLVAMALAAEALRTREDPAGVGLLLVVGEEVDHCGAIAAERMALQGVRHVVLCEPTCNRLVSHQKGLLKVRVVARGRAAHSAFPERGESAVDPLLDFLDAARRSAWPTHPVLGPTTLNIGLISGGVAANVLAPHAEAVLMVRLVGPSEVVLETLERYLGPALSLEVLTRAEPQTLHVPAGDWPTTTASFNSDAVHLAVHAPVTMVGPGDIERAHSDDEHITRQELADGIQLYVELGRALGAAATAR